MHKKIHVLAHATLVGHDFIWVDDIPQYCLDIQVSDIFHDGSLLNLHGLYSFPLFGRLEVLAGVAASSGAQRGDIGQPFLQVLQVTAMATALAPDVEAARREGADGAERAARPLEADKGRGHHTEVSIISNVKTDKIYGKIRKHKMSIFISSVAEC